MKRLGHEFYYYRNTNGHEVDFVIPSKKRLSRSAMNSIMKTGAEN